MTRLYIHPTDARKAAAVQKLNRPRTPDGAAVPAPRVKPVRLLKRQK